MSLGRFAGTRRRKPSLSEQIFNRFVIKYYSRNLLVDLQLAAKRDSIEYIQRHMRQAIMTRDRWDLLEFALARAPAEGAILEFGVERGASLRHLAQYTNRVVHGFDAFEGLPEDWAGTFEQRGKFSQRGRLPQVPGNVRLHVGWFADTVPRFVAENNEPVALLHVDCDIYSSTKTVFDLLGDRLLPGSVIVFDEYFNYPNWQEHEFRAFQEFVKARNVTYQYIGFASANGHVALRITGKS